MLRLFRTSQVVGIAVALLTATLVRPSVLDGQSPPPPPLLVTAPEPLGSVPQPTAVPSFTVVMSPRLAVWGPTPGLRAEAPPPPSIVADAAILLDEDSGIALFEKNAHVHLSPASLTKIMTALIALERGDLAAEVEVHVDSRRMRGSTVMGLVPGERLTLENLLYGLMLPSGNDAALAIAEHIGGTTPAFIDMMNARAVELGLVDTHFANPHGLDSAGHYSSAYDLAVLTRVAMQHEQFRTFASTTYHVVASNMSTYRLGTLNPLYGRLVGVDGVKTGYTRRARQTLVGSVTRDGRRVYVVILRSENRASDGASLLDWAFAAHIWRNEAPFQDVVFSADGMLEPRT